MPESQSVAARGTGGALWVLGVDTCGPAGTVALARIEGENAVILGQKELAGRTYSATLVASVGDLLVEMGLKLGNLGAIAVVHGPGSFTGVRVGLSAVKGLAEPAQIPIVAVSRLAVLAARAGVESAALDAHRNEVFLRVGGQGDSIRELLAGAEELAEIGPVAGRIAVCDEGAAAVLASAWPRTELVRVEAPSAGDAIRLCVPAILGGEFADPVLLDGHYLRRSDAEIFGDGVRKTEKASRSMVVRRMAANDLDSVIKVADATHHAPAWPRASYEKALDPDAQPRRVSVVAEEAGSGGVAGFAIASLIPHGAGQVAEAELESIVTAVPHQRRGVARELFGALKGELRRSGVSDVILEVREGNHGARGFYRFLGFREEGRRKGYYADPAEDAVLMRLRLR